MSAICFKKLLLDLDQKAARQAMIEAQRDRHALQNAMDEELGSLLVKLMGDLSELSDLFFLSLLNGFCLVLSEPLAERVAEC